MLGRVIRRGTSAPRFIDRATFQASSNRRFSSTSWAIGMLRNRLLFCDTDLRGRPSLPFRVVPPAARYARHRRFCARLIRLRGVADNALGERSNS